MAIIDDCPGLEVQIFCNDRPICEYNDHHVNLRPKTSERYVEAQSGAEFEIHYNFTPPFPTDRAVSMLITVDGRDVDEPLLRPEELHDDTGHVSCGPVSTAGPQWFVQKYVFKRLHIREGHCERVPDALKEKLESVGIITCGFYFLENARLNRHPHIAPKAFDDFGTIDEKAVKGESLSHQANLREPGPTGDVAYYDAEYADGGEPFATFHFHYRSHAALQDLYIIKRTPEPLELLNRDDSDLGQINREQMKAIIRRLLERDELRKRMKRERSGSARVVGNDDIGDDGRNDNLDVVETGAVDLRAKRRKIRVRRVPGDEDEVIELD